MEKFLYVFGYCTPKQRQDNREHGWDDENSHGFFILAGTREEALAWGSKLADCYLQILYDDPAVTLESLGYGGWIEDKTNLTAEQISAVPIIRYGDFPDMKKTLIEKYGSNLKTAV